MHRPLRRKCWDNSLDTGALFSAVAELSWTTADISLIPRSTMEIADSRGKFSVFYESHKIYPPAGYFQVVANEDNKSLGLWACQVRTEPAQML